MPTIKRKVEMNLPQLIEWGWDNPEQIKGKYFKSNVKDVFGNHSIVRFSVDSFGFKTDEIRRNDIFTVEVEEEIAEDTELETLVERYMSGYEDAKPRYAYHLNKSIKSVLKGNMPHIKTTHFYTEVNNELFLIWTKEEGLVE